MKKLFTLLALAGFSAATANPLPIGLANGHQAITPKVAPTTIESFYNNVVANTVDKSNSTQAVTYTTVVPFNPAAPWSFLNTGTQFQYDPDGDVLSVYNNYYKLNSGNTAITGTNIAVYTSTNLGKTWVPNTIYNADGLYSVDGGFAIANPAKSKSFADFNMLSVGTGYEMPGFKDVGNTFFIKTGTDIQNANFEGPTANNAAKYNFSATAMQLVPFVKDGKSYVFGVGQPFFDSDKQPTGADAAKYSFFAFSFDNADFITSSIPNELNATNFSSPSPQQTSDNYISKPFIDIDDDGNVYMAVINYMAEDNTCRVPGVIKSTDMGKTWSNLKNMTLPLSLLKEYTESIYQNSPTDTKLTIVMGPYAQNGFSVYGKDKFSFLISLYSENSTQKVYEDNLVECIYDNGTWSLKKLTSLTSFSAPSILYNVTSTTSQFVGRTKAIENPNGNEIQISKTVDGQYLVAKWIDEDTLKGFDGNFTFVVGREDNNTEQLTTATRLNTTDVFMSYRAVNGGNWSKPVNVTDDMIYQKATKIPRILPDYKKVPLIFLENASTTLAQKDSAIAKAPTWVRGMFAGYNYEHSHKAQFYLFDPTTTSVKDENPTTTGQFQLNPVFPNPATGVSEITFSMNKPGMAKLALINQVGQVVKVIYEGQLSEGLKAVTVNTDELAAGVYYYTLTVGDNSATKVLNVVK